MPPQVHAFKRLILADCGNSEKGFLNLFVSRNETSGIADIIRFGIAGIIEMLCAFESESKWYRGSDSNRHGVATTRF